MVPTNVLEFILTGPSLVTCLSSELTMIAGGMLYSDQPRLCHVVSLEPSLAWPQFSWSLMLNDSRYSGVEGRVITLGLTACCIPCPVLDAKESVYKWAQSFMVFRLFVLIISDQGK